MNFSFEGNYRPKRNINLGGVKSIDDKRSLMLKAQNERKAREEERNKLRAVQKIQAFYRGRKIACAIRQQTRVEFEALYRQVSATELNEQYVMTLTRQILLFYQPGKENVHLEQYIILLTPVLEPMFDIKDINLLDSWIWLACLLIKKILLPSIKTDASCKLLSLFIDPITYPKKEQDENRIRLITFTLNHTSLLSTIKSAIIDYNKDSLLGGIIIHLATLHPPYYYSTSLLIEKYQKRPSTEYLTRPGLLRTITLKLLTQPFLLDHLSSTVIQRLVAELPLKDTLQDVYQLHFDKDVVLNDMEIAGLLMNVTQMSNVEPEKNLEGALTNYAQAIQLLLAHLPVSYLIDTSVKINNMTDQEQSSSDDDDDDEEDKDRDVVMTEAPTSSTSAISTTVPVSPLIRQRLESLYSSERVNDLLFKFMQLATITADDDSSKVIQSISSFFNTLMIRWPMKKDTILSTLLYRSRNTRRLLQILWKSWSTSAEATMFNGNRPIMSCLTEAVKSVAKSEKTSCESWSVLYLLCEIYNRLLLTISDDEFLKSNKTNSSLLDIDQVIEISGQLKNISFVMFWRANIMDLSQNIGLTGIQLSQLRTSITQLLQQIHMRDSRRNFCPRDHWLIPGFDTDNFSSEAVAEEFNLESERQQEKNMPLRPLRILSKGRLAVISPRLGLLNNIPFVIPFEQRVEIFRMFVLNDKKRNDTDDFSFHRRPACRVRRNHMFEDGFDGLNGLGVELKNRVKILFVDEFGLEEAGIDGGGVFKEFLTGLGNEAFNLNYGLFVATPDQLLYPNPSLSATEPEQLEYFRFLGLIIGKAVYEGILLDVAFAEFFLKKCLGKVNYLDDLSSLDPELYKGLLAVKNFDGNVEDLALDFTSPSIENGQSKNIELIPGGSHIPVTNRNRIQYVYSVANYRLNIQIAKQCRAFFRGLSTIIDIKWLRMFNQQELQVLLGGASVPINLADLRAHTVLTGYMEHDATVKNFWRVVESFDNPLRMKFVKFVTSCSRPPLLGFKELVPQFCLTNAGVDNERLPTSSTCVNLLKLPNYSSYEILKEKLLYAITADAGFDLS